MSPTTTIPGFPTIPAAPPDSTSLLSAEDFFQRYESQRVELVRGLVQDCPMPDSEHGFICAQITRLLGEFVASKQLGRVMSNDTFLRVRQNPDTVRGADVIYISYERLPKGKLPRGVLTAVPELVFEVRSPSDRWTDLIAKVLDYLQAGVLAVVVVNPLKEAVAVYRTDVDEEHFSRDQVLILPDILPDFKLHTSRLFE